MTKEGLLSKEELGNIRYMSYATAGSINGKALTALLTHIDTLTQVARELRQALKVAEWGDGMSMEYGETCPACMKGKSEGHNSDCEINLALTNTAWLEE